MRRFASLSLALGVILVLSFAAVANAGSPEVWSWSTTPGQTIIDWITTASLQQFDTQGGTRELTGVQIDMSSVITLQAGIENLTNQMANMSYSLDVATTVKRNGTVLTDKHLVKNESPIALAARDGNIDWAGPAGHTWTYAPVTLIANTYNAPTSEFAAYTGTGTIDFNVSAVTASWVPRSDVGSMAAYFVADVPTTVVVTYTYEMIPEPASILAFGTGMISLIGFALKRRA